MKELMLQYARYNQWANKRITDACLAMSNEAIEQDVVSSFRSIKATVYHAWSAEYIWLQRLTLVEHPVWAEAEFKGSFAEACKEWEDASAKLVAFVEKQIDDRAFGHECMYYDRNKMPHKTAVGTILLHIVNHSSYHRGQLVTMLRQLGASSVAGTDFILYSWGKK